ncbi:MAG TPA: hypothetical protein DCP06_03975 [Lachnospiraceae bacterium]|nr:hypothetical protein [Lachnospiraceae bacterium]
MEGKYMIRKINRHAITTLLVLSMITGLTACSNKKDSSQSASGSAVSEAAADVATAEPEPDATEEPDDPNNLIEDGKFDGFSAWAVYKESGGSGSSSLDNGEMVVHISDIGEVQHGVQVYYDGFQLNEKAEYEFSFDARSTVPREILTRFQLNGGDYHAYFEAPVKLTDQMQTFTYSFTMDEPSDPAPRLVFNMGKGPSDSGTGEHDIFFDNMRLVLADDSNVVAAKEEDPTGIRINQVGFRPNDTKTAVFAELSSDGEEFTIVDKKGKEVYKGTLGTSISNESAGETDLIADFSDFKKPGTYRIVASDGTESPKFTIAENVYDKLTKSAIKMLYMQRCGTKLPKKYAGKFAHGICHTQTAYVLGDHDRPMDVSGGWHDAGDYGKYVVAGAKAAADVLLAYDSYAGGQIIDDVGTPESGDGIDDLLQEAKYELDWMLKMQKKDGSVFHKVTCRNFPSTVMPEEETDELIVSFISTPATADFSAVMALAARIYAGSGNSAFKKAAKKYKRAAIKAWKFLESRPDVISHTNPSDVVTGEYPDGEDGDERFWAACELYRTTKSSTYLDGIKTYSEEDRNMNGLGWTDCGLYGSFAALTDKNLKKKAPDTYERIRTVFNRILSETESGGTSSPYMINRAEEFEWGSNLGIANDGVLYLMANRIEKSGTHVNMASEQLSYLLGKNATGYCFVTGFGDNPSSHPHHRISQVVGKAVPGMLVGGPDSALEDPYAKTVLADKPPAKCYADNDQSYSTNEVTIYWNSPLILLLIGLGRA